MSRTLIECVPNFSEGRDRAKVEAIANAIKATPDVYLLKYELDADHNRSVITFAGPPEPVLQGALRAVEKAAELIDLNHHTGVHPRIGAADVVPLIPMEGATMDQCIALAHKLGRQVWELLNIPVYFYERAALHAGRERLENVRRGQFELLREECLTHPDRRPDIGGPALHPTAGATAIGARKFLVAWNVNLRSDNLDAARRIATRVRASSGGLQDVKALGILLSSRKQAQVSMNLTDFEQTPVHTVFEAVCSAAAEEHVEIAGSEIIGLVPKRAFETAAAHYLQCENFTPDAILENRLMDVAPLEPLPALLDDISPAGSPGGGGVASAAAAGLAAALGSKICRLMKREDPFRERMRIASLLARQDVAAFNEVQLARKSGEPLDDALSKATHPPLAVAELASAILRDLDELAPQTPAAFASDAKTGQALARAALEGAKATAETNIRDIQDEQSRAVLTARLNQS